MLSDCVVLTPVSDANPDVSAVVVPEATGGPPQVVLERSVHAKLWLPGTPFGPMPIRRLLSVNDVEAAPEVAPAAETEYVATNQLGRLNWSEMLARGRAVTSTERFQALPQSSLTKMWTVSPGCQPAPVSVTSSPGA